MPLPRTTLRRRSVLFGLAGAACDVAVAAPSSPAGMPAAATLNDLMPPFWRAYDASARLLPAALRAERLYSAYFEPMTATYRRAGTGRIEPPLVARWLASFDPIAPAVRSLHAGFAASYAGHLARFAEAFPDFDAQASPVALLPSLFRFDAHLEPDGASLPLFFGPDGIVRYHGAGADLGVLFSHEIFHCYQAQKNPAISLDPHAPVYASLWLEGVATWVSERLNPGASLLHVLLDDEALYRRGPQTLRRVARALLDRLDSREDADQAAFFSSGAAAEWPARAGYYVGLRVARRVGETLAPAAMAALPAPFVRERLAHELAVLARA